MDLLKVEPFWNDDMFEESYVSSFTEPEYTIDTPGGGLMEKDSSFNRDEELKLIEEIISGKEPAVVTTATPDKIETDMILSLVQPLEDNDEMKKKRAYMNATCPICQNTFFRKYEMMRHLKSTHFQLRPFKCHLCSHGFSRKNHLKTHLTKIHGLGLSAADQKCRRKHSC
mmetsp:Transcript_17816/g.71690  ORF Transcript_17816/g.71690 Transcript_17816/m.71690 type:complete len:170 (-) Transcript_17816:150-659(-)